MPRIFATTHWSLVRAAGHEDGESSRRALETLCGTYWYPIYVYVRRKGHGPEDARDLTQEFFTRLIAGQHLRLADHNKGRFRSFLLGTLHHFLAQEWRRSHRQRRGGQYQFVSLDQQVAEERYQFEAATGDNPERNFHRQWALTVLKETMKALETECAASGKARLFAEVKPLLSGERDGATSLAIGRRLSMTASALRVAVHRLRQRYGQLLRAEIAKTVESEGEVEEELRHLLQTLSE